MTHPDITKQAQQFYALFHQMDRHYAAFAKKYGLTYMSITVLDIIYNQQENCTQKLICSHSFYSKQTVNMIIRSFLKQGWIKLVSSEKDRRSKRILLTEEGQLFTQKALGKIYEAERIGLEKIPPEHIKLILDTTEKFTADLGKMLNEAVPE